MLDQIHKILTTQHIFSHNNQGILVCRVENAQRGILLAKDIVYDIIDSKTVLYLSGGSTPKVLYELIAQEENFYAGGVGMIDERFGEKWHKTSNELMIKQTGLLRYLHMRHIPFYPILTAEKEMDRETTALDYDSVLRDLFAVYQKHITILGIGSDGHTAGLPAIAEIMEEIMKDKMSLVMSYDDQKGMYKKRVTMTQLALEMMDLHIVLVFGEEKKKALDALFTQGKIAEISSRILTTPEIAKKTILITDQFV
jgi:6-phosphogluconolactonase/glucosamine-6-phosphate isomerase/deaminase